MMSGSLVPMRFVILLLLFVVAILFYPLRLLQWDKSPYACFDGRHLSVGEEIVEIGKLSIHGFTYTCLDKNKYDPKTTTPLNQAKPDQLPDY